MTRSHSSSLQGVRGIAAAVVVLMHLADLTANFSPEVWGPISRLAALWGHAGVDVFFVLSGTIMCLVTNGASRSGGRLAQLGSFAVKRVARLYPVFLCSFAVSAFVWIKIQGSPYPTSRQLLDALMLWQSSPLHPVSWTLMWELRFYLMVALLLAIFGRRMKLGFLLWLGYEAAAIGGLVPMTSFTNPIMLEFMYGVVIGLLIGENKVSPAPRLTLAAGVLALVAAGVYTGGDALTIGLTRVYVYGLPAAAILYGLLSMEARGASTPVDRFGWLGDISYSLYLWHFPVFIWLTGYGWSLCGGGAVCGTGYAASALLAAVAVSAVSFHLLERPFVRWANAALAAARRARGPVLAVGEVAQAAR